MYSNMYCIRIPGKYCVKYGSYSNMYCIRMCTEYILYSNMYVLYSNIYININNFMLNNVRNNFLIILIHFYRDNEVLRLLISLIRNGNTFDL